MEIKPNHVCKYSGCKLGKDGGRKEYFACEPCTKIKWWMELACCVEHGCMYQNEVAIARKQRIPYPEYIDQMIEDGVITEDTEAIC